LGFLEWIGAHFLAPLVSLYRAIYYRPKPELKIHKLYTTVSGGPGKLGFVAVVQNVGTKPAMSTVTAQVDDIVVEVQSPVSLLANTEPLNVRIGVPRPGLGEYIAAFGNENGVTLYGRELVVELAEGKRRVRASWREHVYTQEENSVRADIQQREWRIGRGEATPKDILADQKAGNSRTIEPRFPLGPK